METTNINILLVKSYLDLMKNLGPDLKLELIEKLSKSIKTDFNIKRKSLKRAFGAFDTDLTADQLIDQLRASRNININIEIL